VGAGRCEQRCGNAESKEEGRLPRHAHLRTCAPAHHTPHTTHTHTRARTATMSSLLSFLGGAPKAAGPSAATKAADTGNALQKITDHIEILDKKAEHMQKKADAERQQAVAFHKKGGAMNKKRAMQHLKLAKQYDNQIENQFKMQDNLQAQRMALENTGAAQAMVDVMKSGASALRNANDADKVDDLVGDIEELVEDQRRVTDILTSDMGLGAQIDQDELDAEMDELLNGEIDLTGLGDALPGDGDGDAQIDQEAKAPVVSAVDALPPVAQPEPEPTLQPEPEPLAPAVKAPPVQSAPTSPQKKSGAENTPLIGDAKAAKEPGCCTIL